MKPSGLAGELVVAIEEETDVTATVLDRQFARTPYAVSFEAGAEELTLVTLHVIWGDDEARRADELREIAAWLVDWPNRESTWSKNLITLGDFNVNRGPLYDALISTGLTTPTELNDVPRTIFDEPGKQHFYDQIAWFQEDGNRSVLSLEFLSAGSFDFVPLLQGGVHEDTALVEDLRPLPALGRVPCVNPGDPVFIVVADADDTWPACCSRSHEPAKQ